MISSEGKYSTNLFSECLSLQPNYHYPIPASFELTQRVPTGWIYVGPRTNHMVCDGLRRPLWCASPFKATRAVAALDRRAYHVFIMRFPSKCCSSTKPLIGQRPYLLSYTFFKASG